ncbi:RNA-directed DNA polymerase from mobile element jockey-like [Brachionus plicatilis]|uniref:RNA-directed DNA polymerase from mobile element jockey-like n=1 Tax=Brachionus plicatilis TaxID=10195 RepID=A0A3M7R1I7_BRAPC|nr:RNA-directed DNA polymerase from mobile element jockey-like [Brachionus plicatilis]
MKLSTAKTVCTIFTRLNGQGKRKLDIILQGKRIKHDNKPKLLGLKFDKNLTFYDHIKEINARVDRRINMMRSIRGKNWGASPKLLLTTYKTLIRPIMEYIPFIKYSASETSMTTLETRQRKAIKIAYRLPFSTATKDCYKLARIDSIKDRFELLSTRYLQKASNSNKLIKDLIDNYNSNSKPLVKNGVKPILAHILPQTTQSATKTSINQPNSTETTDQSKSKKKTTGRN